MAIITTVDNFYGNIFVAQLDFTPLANAFNEAIQRYEPEYLRKAMGYELAKEFSAGLDAGSPEQRWIDLRDGKEYTIDGVLYKWDGFIVNKSAIADYVYFWWMREQASITTATGEVEANGTVSNGIKMMRAYNEASELTSELYHFLLNAKDEDGDLVYPEFSVACNPFGKVNVFNL